MEIGTEFTQQFTSYFVIENVQKIEKVSIYVKCSQGTIYRHPIIESLVIHNVEQKKMHSREMNLDLEVMHQHLQV